MAAAAAREDVAHVADVDAGGVPARFYRPVDEPDGLVVHLHGGGFVFNDVDTHDRTGGVGAPGRSPALLPR